MWRTPTTVGAGSPFRASRTADAPRTAASGSLGGGPEAVLQRCDEEGPNGGGEHQHRALGVFGVATRDGKSTTWPLCRPSVYTRGGASWKVMIRVSPVMKGCTEVSGTICTMDRVVLATSAMWSSSSAISADGSIRRRMTDSSRIAQNFGGGNCNLATAEALAAALRRAAERRSNRSSSNCSPSPRPTGGTPSRPRPPRRDLPRSPALRKRVTEQCDHPRRRGHPGHRPPVPHPGRPHPPGGDRPPALLMA